MSEPTPETKEKKVETPKLEMEKPDLSLIQVSTVLYTIMAAVGALICIYYHKNFFTIIAPPKDAQSAKFLISVASLGTCVLLISGYLFEGWFPSFEKLKGAVRTVLGTSSYFVGIYLALISAIGEEFLFRGAVLPFTGLFLSAVLFGLLHLDVESGRVSAWSLWAFLAGLLLGWIFESTQSLWPPIAIHFFVNAFSILRLQREQKLTIRT